MQYAARTLRRDAWFTATTVLTLALGVGVLTASFAVVNAVVLEPIVPDQDRVVRIWLEDVQRENFRAALTYHEFKTLREQTRTLASVAAIQYADASTVVLTLDGQPTAAAVTPVSSDFFAVAHGGQPALGRWFHYADEVRGAELVGVASARFWRQATGADPALIGRRLELNAGAAAGIAGGARTLLVIGIAPDELVYPLGTDFWVPLTAFFDGGSGRFDYNDRRFAQFELLGRMRPDASVTSARAEIEILQRRLVEQFPDDYRPMRVVVQPILHGVLGNARQVLIFLFVAAGLVLGAAGVNVAALLLMRAAARRRELAVRLALGASRWRLAREAVNESVLLGTAAAAAGVLFAYAILGTVRALAPADLPRIDMAALDLRALGFLAAAVLAWVATLGTAPIWTHGSVDAARAGDLSSKGRPRVAGLRVFTASQIAAAVVVATAAGLLVQSFRHLQGIDRGFDARNLAVISLLLPDGRYPDPSSRVRFYEELVADVGTIPGVIAAAPIHMNPGTGTVGLSAPFRFEGQTPEDAAKNPWASWDPVTPSYFRTFGVQIVDGRPLTGADSASAAPVAVVSESVARRYWPEQSAIGKRLRLTSEFPWVTVVGVARDLRYRELTKNWMTVYFPAAQFFFFAPTKLVVRTVSDPASVIPAIRARIRAHEPQAAFTSVETMDALLATELSRPRVALYVTALFAIAAILLSGVGVYSVMAYNVTARRYELAVRSALGASRARIMRDVVRESAALGLAGVLSGVGLAALLTRSLDSLLFHVHPGDLPTSAIAGATLLAIVLTAASVPARRAANIDPASVLRAE